MASSNWPLIERSRVQLLPDGAFAPYHAADDLEPEEARESVKRSVATAHDLVTRAVRDAARRYFLLGLAHFRRGNLPRAIQVLERVLGLCRTSQFIADIPFVAASLGAAYALAGRPNDALPLVAGAVAEFRSRQRYHWPALIFLCARMTYLLAGRIDEAASHAQEAIALTRGLAAHGSAASVLCLAGDVASAGGAQDAETYYRDALALAEPRGMRPLVAHCHLGLGKLYRRTGKRKEAQEHLVTAVAMYREMDMTYWLEKAEREMKEMA